MSVATKSIKWENLTSAEMFTIRAIVARLASLRKIDDKTSAEMDISATHLSCPLKLDALLQAKDFDFLHDTVGIINHIDRKTGELSDHFLPRYAKPETKFN